MSVQQNRCACTLISAKSQLMLLGQTLALASCAAILSRVEVPYTLCGSMTSLAQNILDQFECAASSCLNDRYPRVATHVCEPL